MCGVHRAAMGCHFCLQIKWVGSDTQGSPDYSMAGQPCSVAFHMRNEDSIPPFHKAAVILEGCVTKRSELGQPGSFVQLDSKIFSEMCHVTVVDSGATIYVCALTTCLQIRKCTEKLCLSDHWGCDCHQLQWEGECLSHGASRAWEPSSVQVTPKEAVPFWCLNESSF